MVSVAPAAGWSVWASACDIRSLRFFPLPVKRGEGKERLRRARLSARTNLFQHRQKVADELLGIFAHREVAEVFHDDRLRAGAARDLQRALGSAGIVVLAGEQIERAAPRVDLVELAGDVAVDHVEM